MATPNKIKVRNDQPSKQELRLQWMYANAHRYEFFRDHAHKTLVIVNKADNNVIATGKTIEQTIDRAMGCQN